MLGAVFSNTRYYLIILCVFFFAITNAFWFKYIIEESGVIKHADGTFSGYLNFLTIFYTFVLFGDASKQMKDEWDTTEWIFFFIINIFIGMIMMSFLISLIGETYG